MTATKRVLIAYPQMMLGGSTTSLLSLLNEIDTAKYDVSLLLSYSGGPYEGSVPPQIRLLPWAYRYQNEKERKFRRLLSPRYMAAKITAVLIGRLHRNPRLAWQYLEEKNVDFYRDVEEEYDVAIAFLEGQMCKYVADHVKAKRKIAWIHIDYRQSRFDPRYDRRSLACFDKIVLVSDKCRESFRECFPSLSDRTVVVENILSSRYLHLRADEGVDLPSLSAEKLNLVTTCRISFSSKGLDRAVRVIGKLKREQYPGIENLSWYVIGEGQDKAELDRMVKEEGLQEQIHLLGMKANPYPYLMHMDLFFLPSRWEGKPMAVTEAQILGLPTLVTHYLSAPEQIRDRVDGMIVENSEEGICGGLRFVLDHPEMVERWREETARTRYDNTEEIGNIEALIDGDN